MSSSHGSDFRMGAAPSSKPAWAPLPSWAASLTSMGSMPAETRRAMARGVVQDLLREGRRFENVSLRDVARELGVPLSTLTYVYSSIDDLFDDYGEPIDDLAMSNVGSSGLRAELRRYVDQACELAGGDRAVREIWRFRLSRVGGGVLVDGVDRAVDMVQRIREDSGEVYALSDEELGLAFRAIMEGVALIWLDGGASDPEDLRRTGLAAVEIVVRSADPQSPGRLSS